MCELIGKVITVDTITRSDTHHRNKTRILTYNATVPQLAPHCPQTNPITTRLYTQAINNVLLKILDDETSTSLRGCILYINTLTAYKSLV